MDNNKDNQLPQAEIVLEAYYQWLAHPITKLFIQNLQAHREQFISKLGDRSMDKETTDAHYRLFGAGLQACNSIIALTTDFERFTRYLVKPNTKQ